MLRECEVGCDLKSRGTLFALVDSGMGDAVRCTICCSMVVYRLSSSTGHIFGNRCGCGPRIGPNDAR